MSPATQAQRVKWALHQGGFVETAASEFLSPAGITAVIRPFARPRHLADGGFHVVIVVERHGGDCEVFVPVEAEGEVFDHLRKIAGRVA